jgi:hypothetical protein
MQIRAIAIKNGYTDSQEITATYTIDEPSGNGWPWQMVVSTRDPREVCELTPGEAVTYYTHPSVKVLVNNTFLYTDSNLTQVANDGFYLDINDTGSRQVWMIIRTESAPGLMKLTEFNCQG